MSAAAAPTYTETVTLARSLAYHAAQQPADVDDLTQEALFAWHNCTQRQRGNDARKPFSLARTVMQFAMFSYYSRRWSMSGARHRAEDCFLEELPSGYTAVSQAAPNMDRLSLQEYLDALSASCGTMAAYIAKNLLMPQDLWYCRLISDAAQGPGRRRARPTHGHLREALGLTPTEWKHLLQQVRVFTARWLLYKEELVAVPECVHQYAATTDY